MALQPRVPLEVQERILNDVVSLAPCALVCTKWRAIVQPWLFSTLTVRNANERKLDSLHTFFSNSSHCGALVKKLILEGEIGVWPPVLFVTSLAESSSRRLIYLFRPGAVSCPSKT